jgi:hypothetical protein
MAQTGAQIFSQLYPQMQQFTPNLSQPFQELGRVGAAAIQGSRQRDAAQNAKQKQADLFKQLGQIQQMEQSGLEQVPFPTQDPMAAQMGLTEEPQYPGFKPGASLQELKLSALGELSPSMALKMVTSKGGDLFSQMAPRDRYMIQARKNQAELAPELMKMSRNIMGLKDDDPNLRQALRKYETAIGQYNSLSPTAAEIWKQPSGFKLQEKLNIAKRNESKEARDVAMHDEQMQNFIEEDQEYVTTKAEKAKANLKSNGTIAAINAAENYAPTIQSQYQMALTGNSAAQRAMVVAFNKLIEPSSAVMAGEAEATGMRPLMGAIYRMFEGADIVMDKDGELSAMGATLSPTEIKQIYDASQKLIANTNRVVRRRVGQEQLALDLATEGRIASGDRYDLGFTTVGRSSLDWIPEGAKTVEVEEGMTGEIAPDSAPPKTSITAPLDADPFPKERNKLPSGWDDARMDKWKGGSGKDWIRAKKPDGSYMLYSEKSGNWFTPKSTKKPKPAPDTKPIAPVANGKKSFNVGGFTIEVE